MDTSHCGSSAVKVFASTFLVVIEMTKQWKTINYRLWFSFFRTPGKSALFLLSNIYQGQYVPGTAAAADKASNRNQLLISRPKPLRFLAAAEDKLAVLAV